MWSFSLGQCTSLDLRKKIVLLFNVQKKLYQVARKKLLATLCRTLCTSRFFLLFSFWIMKFLQTKYINTASFVNSYEINFKSIMVFASSKKKSLLASNSKYVLSLSSLKIFPKCSFACDSIRPINCSIEFRLESSHIYACVCKKISWNRIFRWKQDFGDRSKYVRIKI